MIHAREKIVYFLLAESMAAHEPTFIGGGDWGIKCNSGWRGKLGLRECEYFPTRYETFRQRGPEWKSGLIFAKSMPRYGEGLLCNVG